MSARLGSVTRSSFLKLMIHKDFLFNPSSLPWLCLYIIVFLTLGGWIARKRRIMTEMQLGGSDPTLSFSHCTPVSILMSGVSACFFFFNYLSRVSPLMSKHHDSVISCFLHRADLCLSGVARHCLASCFLSLSIRLMLPEAVCFSCLYIYPHFHFFANARNEF